MYARNLANHVVYSYDLLWSSNDISRLDTAISSIPFDFEHRRLPNVKFSDISVPLFANSKFVGTEFAFEATLRYFKALTSAEIDYRCVRPNLERDRFGPMHLPLKKVMNPLIISMNHTWAYTFGQTQFEKRQLKDSLDSLLTLKDDRDIKIIIYLCPTMQRKKILFEFLEIARPFFHTFRDANMDVKFMG